MRVVTADEVERALGEAELVERLRAAFIAGCVQPIRTHHTIAQPGQPEATLLFMPAWQEGGPVGIKLVTIFPGNAAKGLPSVQGFYILLDGATGEARAAIDARVLTAKRTAAASALASTYLSYRAASRLLMVGTGMLAPYLIQAHATVRPIRHVMLWGRHRDKAEALAKRLGHAELRLEAVSDLEAAAREADIISCATLSQTPLIKGAWLRPGQHLDLVGAYTPAMRESDDEAVRRARVYVDTREGALKEGGDIAQPLADGVLSEAAIRGDLYELCRNRRLGRQDPEEITLFKSVGAAIEDLTAAQLVMERLEAGAPADGQALPNT
jgi:ornithine cyclodeaminase